MAIFFLQYTISSILKSNNGWLLFYFILNTWFFLKKKKETSMLKEKGAWISEICIHDSIPNWNQNSYFQMANEILELTSHYLDKAITFFETPCSRQIGGSFEAFQIIEITELPVSYFTLFCKLHYKNIHKSVHTYTHTHTHMHILEQRGMASLFIKKNQTVNII